MISLEREVYGLEYSEHTVGMAIWGVCIYCTMHNLVLAGAGGE